MRNTLTIARRELLSYFNGPVAYIVAIIMLGVVGFTYAFAGDGDITEWHLGFSDSGEPRGKSIPPSGDA